MTATDHALLEAGRMDRRVLTEQLRLFFEQSKDAIIGHAAVGLATVALLYEEGSDGALLALWGGLLLCVAAARVMVYRNFPSASEGDLDVRAWSRRFQALSLLSGGTFGALPVLFLDPADFITLAWILLIMAGLAGGALGTLSAFTAAFRSFIAAAVLPLVVVLVASAQVNLAIIAGLAVLMSLYFMRFSKRFEDGLVAQIRGRLENVDLVERVTRQTDAIESMMRALPNAIAVIDEKGTFRYSNERLSELFDLPEEMARTDLTSDAFNLFRCERGDFDHLDPEDFLTQTKRWAQLKSAGDAFGYERTLRDGRILRVENHPLADGGWVRSWTDISIEKAARAETARWSELLQLTLNNIDQGLSLIDGNGDQVMANARYCEMLGLPIEYTRRKVAHTKVIEELFAKGELAHLSPELEERLDKWESGEDPAERIVYERRQASGRWLLVAANRLPDGGHVRTFTDITERREAEDEARTRQEMLEAVLRHIDQGVIMRDADDNIVLFNERLSELLDVSPDMYRQNTSSTRLSEFHRKRDDYPEEIQEKVMEWHRKREAGEPLDRLEYQRAGPTGGWLHVIFQALPERRELRTFTDVSTVKAVEKEITEKTTFLEAVLQSMEQGVFVTDVEGRVSLYNQRTLDILGIPEEILASRPSIAELRMEQQQLGDLNDSDPEVEIYFDAFDKWVAEAGSDEIFSWERQITDGRWVLISGRKLPDGGIVRNFTDITSRKENETELIRAKEEAEEARDIAEVTEERTRAILQSIPVGASGLRAGPACGVLERCLLRPYRIFGRCFKKETPFLEFLRIYLQAARQ